MYKLMYYQKRPDGTLFNGTVVAGYECAPYGVCNGRKNIIKHTTHRLGVLKIEKV